MAILKLELSEVRNNVGNFLKALGLQETAATSSTEALRISPAYLEARSNLVNSLTTLGRCDEAANCCRQVLKVCRFCVPARSVPDTLLLRAARAG